MAEKKSRRGWLIALLILMAVLIVGVGYIAYRVLFVPYKPQTFSRTFAANERLFAYTQLEDRGWFTVIYDHQEDAVFRPSPPPGDFISRILPHPGERDRFFALSARILADRPENTRYISQIWDCEIDTRVCEKLFTYEGKISSFWPTDERLYFVGSGFRMVDMPRSVGLQRVFTDHDIWAFDRLQGTLAPITSLGLSQLSSLSIAGDVAAFQAFGYVGDGVSARVRPADATSEIFIVSYPFRQTEITAQFEYQPLVIGEDIDVRPSLSAEARFIAMNSSSFSGSFGFRYDIVVADIASGQEWVRIIEPPDGQLTAPAFIGDHRIAFRVSREGESEIRMADVTDKAEITIDQTILLKAIDFVVDLDFIYRN